LRTGVSQLMATVIIVAVVLSIGAFFFAYSIGFIRLSTNILDAEIPYVRATLDNRFLYLTIGIKNTGSQSISSAYVVGYDTIGNEFLVLVTVNLMSGMSGSYTVAIPTAPIEYISGMKAVPVYIHHHQWFVIISTQPDTWVYIYRLNSGGGVVAQTSYHFTSEGQYWSNWGWVTYGGVTKILATKPVFVYGLNIEPDDYGDAYYSLTGTDLWLYIQGNWGRNFPGFVFITAYHDNTHISIKDYGNGDQTQERTLNRGEFLEFPNIPNTEIWHIKSNLPITVVAGLMHGNNGLAMYHQIRSPGFKTYYFPALGDNPYVQILAYEDGTSIVLDNMDGGSGDWSGTLNKDQWVSILVPPYRRVGEVRWSRVRISSNKPIMVVVYDKSNYGTSDYVFPGKIGGPVPYGILTAGGYRLILVSYDGPNNVNVQGIWSGTLNRGGYVNIGVPRETVIKITSTYPLSVFTYGWDRENNWNAAPPLYGFIKGETYPIVILLVGEDGSIKEYSFSFKL